MKVKMDEKACYTIPLAPSVKLCPEFASGYGYGRTLYRIAISKLEMCYNLSRTT